MTKELVLDICDNTSVGIIARDNQDRILMIQRKKYPFGYACPAGHCDGDAYPRACHKEFEEETGLKVVGAPHPVIPKNPRKENKCRRGGEFHYWQLFEVNWTGELRQNEEETKWVGWMAVEEVRHLAAKTQEYVRRWKLAGQAMERSWTEGIRESLEKEWEKSPGLEIVWYEFFQELKII
ncbi:MAG: NUDIX hydrolase [Candidatus Taylorbacteria bacterium]|nr:NUDIX hydrolase [Candidatus Taylorbacteria bacterium]